MTSTAIYSGNFSRLFSRQQSPINALPPPDAPLGGGAR
jgi:hypothetical protein